MSVAFPSCPSCLSSKSVKIHVTLSVIMIALFIIGSLAAGGVLNSSMGVTPASYLCYGAYGGTVLFGILEIVNLYLYERPNRQKESVKEIPTSPTNIDPADPFARVLSEKECEELKSAIAKRTEKDSSLLQNGGLSYLNGQIDVMKFIPPNQRFEMYANGIDRFHKRFTEILKEEIGKIRGVVIQPIETEQKPKPLSKLKPVPEDVAFVETKPTEEQLVAIKGFVKDYHDTFRAEFIAKNGLEDRKGRLSRYVDSESCWAAFASKYIYGEDGFSERDVVKFMKSLKNFVGVRQLLIQHKKSTATGVLDQDYEPILDYELLCLAIVNVTPELIEDVKVDIKDAQAEQKPKSLSKLKPVSKNIAFVDSKPNQKQREAILKFVKEYYAVYRAAFIEKNGLKNGAKEPIPVYSDSIMADFESEYMDGETQVSQLWVARWINSLKKLVEERQQDIRTKKANGRIVVDRDYTLIHDYELLCLAIVNATPELIEGDAGTI